MKKHLIWLLTVLVLTAEPIHAENLLSNPNFDSSTQFWSGVGSAGSFTHDATRGSPATGSISVSASGMTEATFGVLQCVSITGGFPITFGARARQGATSGSAEMFVILRVFEGPSCTGSILGTQIGSAGASVPGIPAGQDFVIYSGNTTSAPNARSAQLLANLQINKNGSSIQAWFDSMLLDTDDSLFSNSFE